MKPDLYNEFKILHVYRVTLNIPHLKLKSCRKINEHSRNVIVIKSLCFCLPSRQNKMFQTRLGENANANEHCAKS